ncbi:MAG: hypothetical protein EA427_12980, partial [Spirochaetaceae bacterium]
REPEREDAAEKEEEAPLPPDPSLRKKLQDMIGKVRDQLGPPREPDPDEPVSDNPMDKHAKLFKYLMGLAESLPPDRDREYRQSEESLKLAGVTSRLSGRPTFRERLKKIAAERAAREGHSVTAPEKARTSSDVAGAMNYLAELSSHHPDPDIGARLGNRARNLGERLQRQREKGASESGAPSGAGPEIEGS